MSRSTNRCGHCQSSRIIQVHLGDGASCYVCADCGGMTPYAIIHPEDAAFFCQECYQPLSSRETSPEVVEDYHKVDLPFPRCTIHKAEKVQARRASFRLIQGTA